MFSESLHNHVVESWFSTIAWVTTFTVKDKVLILLWDYFGHNASSRCITTYIEIQLINVYPVTVCWTLLFVIIVLMFANGSAQRLFSGLFELVQCSAECLLPSNTDFFPTPQRLLPSVELSSEITQPLSVFYVQKIWSNLIHLLWWS